MPISGSRVAALLLFDFMIFGIAAFLLIQAMPKPLKPFDYLVVGVVATLISLLAIWLLLLRENPNKSEVLYKLRPRNLEGGETK